MKRLLCFLIIVLLCVCFCGCAGNHSNTRIVATTLPVYDFTVRLCAGTDIEVMRLITESVSCLHNYTLQTAHMRAIENAQIVVISGAGLEDFMADALAQSKTTIDSSVNIALSCPIQDNIHHDHDSHSHVQDSHIWLSPANAKMMAQNICNGLITNCPEHSQTFQENLKQLLEDLEELSRYASQQLHTLASREIMTFHDGFSYLASAFDLTIVHAIEEESGAEASAAELIDMIQIVSEHDLRAIFTERNGSNSAAKIIAAETNTPVYELDMVMAGNSYFEAMYHNIDTLKEALE